VNPDFGYLNSQVPDKTAFKYYLGALAGEQTQLELQEVSQNTSADIKSEAGIAVTEVKSPVVKIEKENLPPSGTM
jgi:hypothetical protein